MHSENSTTHFKLPVFRITTSEKTGEKPEEDFKLLAYSTTSSEEIKKLLEINVQPEEVSQNFINNWKSMHSENSTTHFKLPVFRITISEKTGEKPEEDFKLLAYSTTSSEEIKKLLENSTTHFKLPVFRITISEKTGEKPEEQDDDYLSYAITDPFFRQDVFHRYNCHLIFATNRPLELLLIKSNTWYMDGIFKIVNKPFNQLLMVDSFSKSGENMKQVPLNFIVMSGKNKKDYKKVKLLPDITTSSEKKGEKLVENSKKEERSNTQVNEKENKDEEKEEDAENLPKNGENVVSSQNLDRPTTQEQRQDENSKTEERSNTQVNKKENKDVEKQEVAENLPKHGENVVSSQNLDRPTTQEQRQDENSKKEERSNTQVNEKEHKDEEKQEVAENLQENGDNVVSSQNLDRPTTQDQRQDERRESTEASEGSTNRPIHPVDRHTTYNSEEDNRIVMRDSMIQIPSSEVNTDISSDESWSTFESTLIRLYRNVIRNETSRMMSSIDMVGFEAEHLFGLERSRIFFDLLDEELFQFESAGAISEFVANMAESTVRQHVISFFEHANDTMSRLMTLLLRCTDSKILQQMPIQNFTSLMKSVIKSSLKAQTKGREKVSLEGNIYTMVDQKDFERALGEEIPEDVLNRLRSEDEMVVQRFVDTRQERHQPSDRKEDRPIQCIYFPSDCRLYIYMPTLNGSYWHGSDMRRAKRIRRHSR